MEGIGLMNAPLTMQVALAFGIIGLAVALLADALPRRPSTPHDWDPYRWRMWQERMWPEEPAMRELYESSRGVGFSVIDRVRTALQSAAARGRDYVAGVSRVIRTRQKGVGRKAQWRKPTLPSSLRNANV